MGRLGWWKQVDLNVTVWVLAVSVVFPITVAYGDIFPKIVGFLKC